jgi:hypothetical protein
MYACTMYVLDGKIQAGNTINKWQTRARLAVYLGNLMHHAAGLARSLTTGLVPQAFYEKYDNGFDAVAQTYGRYLPKSQRQLNADL